MGLRLLDRLLGRISGVEAVRIPEVLPPSPSLPEMKKTGGCTSTAFRIRSFICRRVIRGRLAIPSRERSSPATVEGARVVEAAQRLPREFYALGLVVWYSPTSPTR